MFNDTSNYNNISNAPLNSAHFYQYHVFIDDTAFFTFREKHFFIISSKK